MTAAVAAPVPRFPLTPTNVNGILHLYGVLTIGASGAVTSTTLQGITVTKLAGDGKYKVQANCSGGLSFAYVEMVPWMATAADATYLATTGGTTSDGDTVEMQYFLDGTGAANPPSGDKAFIHLVLKTSY